jgi:hypothetical protein
MPDISLTYIIVRACKASPKTVHNINYSLILVREYIILPGSYRLYNESQCLQQIASLAPKRCLVEILVTNFVERMPGERKDGGHHILVPPLLRALTILNMNILTPPRLGRHYLAMPCGTNFVGLFMAHLSMSKLSGFADAISMSARREQDYLGVSKLTPISTDFGQKKDEIRNEIRPEISSNALTNSGVYSPIVFFDFHGGSQNLRI